VSVINTLKTLKYDELRQRYEFIYDVICNSLDKEFENNNYCDFQNDKCIANRLGRSRKKTMGCCYPYDDVNPKVCKYLENKKCTAQCISCKLSTCGYLKERNIKFNINKFLLAKSLFSRKQLDVLRFNFFKPKELILDKLIKVNNNFVPYPIYYLFMMYSIQE